MMNVAIANPYQLLSKVFQGTKMRILSLCLLHTLWRSATCCYMMGRLCFSTSPQAAAARQWLACRARSMAAA